MRWNDEENGKEERKPNFLYQSFAEARTAAMEVV